MRRWAKAYHALVKATWLSALEYRAQTILWLPVMFIFPLVMMSVWLAITDEAGPAAGWQRADFIAYYVGLSVVSQLTDAWVLWDWDRDIRTGDLSVKLLKPVDPFHYLLADQLGWKIIVQMFIIPPLIVVTWLVPELRYTSDPLQIAACAGSVVAGFILNLLMASAFGMVAFWSTQSKNLYSLWYGLGQFLSGYIAPLALFPAGFRQVAYLLPFRSSQGFPMEILMGRLAWPEIGFGLAITGLWIVLFGVLYRLLWRLGLRRYEAVGA